MATVRILVLSTVYVIVGCLYKSQKQGMRGMEACPNYEFWNSTLPGLVKVRPADIQPFLSLAQACFLYRMDLRTLGGLFAASAVPPQLVLRAPARADQLLVQVPPIRTFIDVNMPENAHSPPLLQYILCNGYQIKTGIARAEIAMHR